MDKYQRMVANIDRIICLEYDLLDKQLRNGLIDQDTYNEEARAIDEWARESYADLERV